MSKLTLKGGLVLRPFDPWRSPLCTCPPKYSLHPYTGCSHFCLYCYATAYIGRRPSTPKRMFLEKLARDLERVYYRGIPVELSTSSDPYPPEEREYGLTRKTLRLLISKGAKVLITTKSDLVARDADILAIGKAAVMITITTSDYSLASKLEPGAPSPRRRLEAMSKLAEQGVSVGLRLDPILPSLNDDRQEIRELLEAAASAGAKTVVTSTYKARRDNLRRVLSAFPELEGRYRRLYLEAGERVKGYFYLPSELRRRILELVKSEAERAGMQFAVCREGFKDLITAPSCDGSHLIDLKSSSASARGISS